VKLGLTQYAATSNGKNFVEAAARFKVAGVEPYIGDEASEFLNWTDKQAAEFKSNANKLGIQVPSVALGLFNGDSALVDRSCKDKAVQIIERSLKFTHSVGANVMLLCGFLVSNPNTEEKKKNLISVSKSVESLAREFGITVALELPLPAEELAGLVDHLKSRTFGVYYDFGNAVALGFDPVEEVAILGSRIVALHAKDSGDKIGSLHFGQGKLRLESAMKAIHSIGYDGWVMVETFADDEAETKKDLEKVRRLMTDSKPQGPPK
jgi:sugar phosphate isomerase/epimerase